MNKQMKSRIQTYKYREQTDGCQRGWGEGLGKMGEGEWEILASSYGVSKLWE